MKKGWVWPALVVGLLSLTVVVDGVMVYVATSRSSFAVEDEYYERATNWDAEKERRRASERLGWSLEYEFVAPVRDARQGRVVRARLLDAEGEPIEGARVTLETFHHARADRVLRATLLAGSPGVYEAPLPIRKHGRWQLRLEAHRGTAAYLDHRAEWVEASR